MGTLNEILSLMCRMDKGYGNAVKLNENGIAFQLLDEGHNRERVARQRSLYELQKIFADEHPTEEQLIEKLKAFENVYYHDSYIQGSNVMRLEPLICRIAFGEGGFGEPNADSDILGNLKDIVDFLYEKRKEIDLAKIIDENSLYTWTLEDLDDKFGNVMRMERDSEYQEINNTEYTPNDYEIVGPLDFETANKYGNQSCPSSKLCYTQSEDTWNSYTNNGNNAAYVALKKGWEGIESIHDDFENSPYDTYGLSMIFVFVSPSGVLTTCNTRWNHRADYPDGVKVDHALTRKQVSEIIGMNFFKVFKPNDVSQFNNPQEMQKLLSQMANNDFSAFDSASDYGNIKIVKLKNKYNIVSNGQFKFKKWFDGILEIKKSILNQYGGLILVGRNNKYNFVNGNGDLVWKKPYFQWFDGAYCDYFAYFDFCIVWIGNKKNLMQLNGTLLWDKPINQWFNELTIGNHFIRVANVRNYKKFYNILQKDGTLMCDEWFDWIDYTTEEARDGYYDSENATTRCIIQRKIGILDVNEKTISFNKSPKSLVDGCQLRKGGFYKVELNGDYNYMTEDGTLLSDLWFKELYDFLDDVEMATVKYWCEDTLEMKYNWMRKDGTFVWNKPPSQWFDDTSYFWHHGSVAVEMQNKKNFMNLNGRLLWDKPVDEWFDEVDARNFVVKLNNKQNVLKQSGTLMFEYWFDNINWDESYNMYVLMINEKEQGMQYNFASQSGEIYFDFTFDYVFKHGTYYEVCKGGKSNLLKKDGTLLWKRPINEWFYDISIRHNGTIIVYEDVDNVEKRNVLLPNGELVWKHPKEEWFDLIRPNEDGEDGSYLVVINSKKNFLTGDGKLVWNRPPSQWFDDVTGNATYMKGVMGPTVYVIVNGKLKNTYKKVEI